MLRNDYSLSSDANLGTSRQDIHLDSASLSSSESMEKRDAPTFKASTDLQHIIFIKLQEVSRENLEAGFIDQALHGYERCTEQLLNILRGDTNSPTFVEYLYATLNHLNDVALTFLRAGDIDNAIKILNKCLEISHPEPYKAHPDVQSLTFNHLGCCYRRMGDLDQALYCLQRAVHYHEKALEAGIQMNHTESSSITNINLCAVLSQKGNHKKALEHAKKAVVDCTRDFIHAPRRHPDILKSDAAKKKATMLAIAYYNLGVEEDFCKNPEYALEAYEKAFQFAEEHCGASDPVTLRFHQAYKEAKSKKKSVSPSRCPSAKRLASPTSSTQVSFRAPPLSRPQSASNLKPRDPASARLDLFTSPRARSKLSLITNPSVSALDNSATPKYAQSVRSAMLSKTLTSPTGTNRRPPVVPTRGLKKNSRTPTANAKFFFPMGNRAPLFEKEKSKENNTPGTGARTPSSSKPSRPNTANPNSKVAQEHRHKRPQSSKAGFETVQGRRDMARSDGFETQYNSIEDVVEDRRPVITITKPDFNNYKAFISPTNEGFTKFTLTQGNNDSTKWTSAMGEMTEEAGFSFRRRGTISPKNGEIQATREEYRQKGKDIIEEVLKYGDLSVVIQKYWQGYKVRRALRRSGIEITKDKYWTGLNKIINRDLEENGVVGQYCVVMVYAVEEQKVYVEVKDMKTRAIYKGGVGYPLEKDEVKMICNKLLENIIIEDGRMAFKQKQIEEIKEDLMEQISEKSEESDVGPLIEALEKQVKDEFIGEDEDIGIGEEIYKEDCHKIEESYTSNIKLERFNTNETQEMSSKRGETSKRGSISRRGDMSQLDPDMTLKEEFLLKESLVKKKSFDRNKSLVDDNRDQENNLQSKRSKATSSYTDIEESSSKSSKIVIFAKRAIVKGHLVSFRLESHTNMKRKTKLVLSCFDSVVPSKIETVELPLHLSEKKDINVSDLLDYVNIEFEPFKVTLQSVRQETKVNQDSFSSHDNASIICDISGTQDQRVSGLLRSRSLGKQPSFEDHPHNKNYKAYNSTILDSHQNQEREGPKQYLGVNTRARVPKLLPVEETKYLSLGLGLKVPEVSSGREYSSQDIPVKRTLRDSRTSVSQGEYSQRSEAEGSIMLRMTEGVALYCRVAYKRGESEAIIKYSLAGSESTEFEELRLSLEELGLEAASDIDKDVLLEKIRSLLGKRMKYRNGTVVYEKKPVSRQGTMPSSQEGDTRDTSRKKQREIKDDSEGNIDRQEVSGTIPILKKIEEDEEEWQRRPTESDVLKTTKGTQEILKISKNHILIADEDRKRVTDSPKITLRKATADIDSLDSPSQSNRSGRSNRSSKSPSSGVFGKGEIGNLHSLLKPVVGSPSLRKDIGNFSEEVAMIETFGVLHNTDSGSDAEKTLRVVQQRNRAITTEDKTGVPKLKKKQPSVEDLMGKRQQGKTVKVQTSSSSSKGTLSPKKSSGVQANNLRPPDNRRGEDSSPKVRSNFMVRVNETNSENVGSPTQSVWSSLMEHHSEADERREGGTNSRGSLLKSPRSYAGDIPKIVIHGEKGKSKVMDFQQTSKTMSLGMLEEEKEKGTPVKKKTLHYGFSMGANDGKEEEQQQIMQNHDWEKLKAIQSKQQERRNKAK